MSRYLSLLFLLFLSITPFAQAQTKAAEAKTYAFKVVPGKTYLVSVAPESDSDAVIGVGSDPSRPLTIVNNQSIRLSETYKLQAITEELQVSVFVNSKSGDHTIAVIGDDQKFPFLKWSEKYPIKLETDAEGYITSFGFKWQKKESVKSLATSDINRSQFIAAGSAISYTFKSHPQFPLDIMVVPDTNHIDLALQLGNDGEFELNDNNRNPADLSETMAGQVEWVQYNPTGDVLKIVVVNKSDFGGSFRMAVRLLFNKMASLRPQKWEYLDAAGLGKLLDASRSKLPFIDDSNAAVLEFTPLRTVKAYTFAAIALDPDLNFAIVVRMDPLEPPLFVQAGGTYTRSVLFEWDSENGVVSLNQAGARKQVIYRGFPSPGKIQISLVGYGGSGRVGVVLKDETLAPIALPRHEAVPRSEIETLLGADYKGNSLIHSNFRLYRFESRVGETYKVQVSPQLFFDAVIMDPSGRNFENPTALALVDDKGEGEPETFEITATADFIEFAVAGTRYENGIVDADNKRLGGTGFFKLDVEDPAGNTPILREALEISLPNDFVTAELGLVFQPWDPFEKETGSSLPPYNFIYDRRVIKALSNPLEPVVDTAKSHTPKTNDN